MILTRDGVFCEECHQRLKKENIIDRASNVDEPSFFKDWKGEDLTTAFFEYFARYLKEPSFKDINIIRQIWLWSVHGNHTLSKTISYVFKWNNMQLMQEYNKWKDRQE